MFNNRLRCDTNAFVSSTSDSVTSLSAVLAKARNHDAGYRCFHDEGTLSEARRTTSDQPFASVDEAIEVTTYT